MSVTKEMGELLEGDWGKLDDPDFKFPKSTPRERAGSAVAPTTNRAFKILGAKVAQDVLDRGFHFASKGHSAKFKFPTRPRVAKACGLSKSQLAKLDKADLRVMPRKSDPKYDWYFDESCEAEMRDMLEELPLNKEKRMKQRFRGAAKRFARKTKKSACPEGQKMVFGRCR